MEPTRDHSHTIRWEERPLPHLLRLSWPIVVSMLSYSLMTLVDTIFVARLGADALAGVGLGGISYFVLLCFPMGTLYAVKILVSQAVGAGRHERIPTVLGAGLRIALGMGAVMTAIGLAVSFALPHMTTSAGSGAAASQYLALRLMGLPIVLGRIAIEQTRMGMDDSQSPMRVTLLACATNIGLDYLFIVVLGHGVAGAAVATVMSNVVGFLVMVLVQRGQGFGLRSARLADVRSVLRLGLPSGAQFMLEVGAFGVLVVMLTRMSDLDAAANQIGIQVLHFGFLPCVAMGEGASIMAGQAIGAGRRDLVERVSRLALLPTMAYAMLCSSSFLLADKLIVSAFTDEPHLVGLTISLLHVAALFQMADGASIVARSVLRGVGDVQVTAWLSIGITWAITPPLTWALGYGLGLGALGGWYALCIEMFLSASVFWARLTSTRWHTAATLVAA